MFNDYMRNDFQGLGRRQQAAGGVEVMSRLGDELALIGLARRLSDIEARIKNLEDAIMSEQE